MSNSRTRRINYTPRMTDMEAFDKLPPKLKHALETALISWGAYSVYRQWQKTGDVDAIVRSIREADAKEAKRPWDRGVPSPTHALGLKPLKPNYAACA